MKPLAVRPYIPHQIDGLALLLPILLRSIPAPVRGSDQGSRAGVRDVVDSVTRAAQSWLEINPCPNFSGQGTAGDARDVSGSKLVSLSLALPLLVQLDDIHHATGRIENFLKVIEDGKKTAVLNHLWAILLSSDDYERKAELAHWFQSLLKPKGRLSKL